jgi:hypothetical protein
MLKYECETHTWDCGNKRRADMAEMGTLQLLAGYRRLKNRVNTKICEKLKIM